MERAEVSAHSNGAGLPPSHHPAPIDPFHAAHPHHHHHHEHAGLLTSVQSLLTIITVSVFIITFVVQPFRIPSPSMVQTLLVGDFLLVNKQTFAPSGLISRILLPYQPVRRGDIIVFHYPVDPELHLVKRVIGLPGDRLHLEHGAVFVNGGALHEPYAVYRRSYADAFRDNFPAMGDMDPGVDTHWWAEMRQYVHGGELTVPPGSYFVMGDNRNDSQDSRYWGFVPQQSIVGQPLLVYFSLRVPGPPDGLPTNDPANEARWDAKRSSTGPLGRFLNDLEDLARWDRSFRVVK